MFLLIGAVLANFIGTTGASMLLIRPLLQTNSERGGTLHIPIFFIFLVSNIGGSLTPFGGFPAFHGAHQGRPFFWTLRLFPLWALMVAGVLAMFYFLDRHHYHREECRDLIRDRQRVIPLRITGTINFLWIAGVIAAIFLPFPRREGALILMAVLSLLTTKRECRTHNKFNYNPILEVAILFAGIFVTMIPALLILNARGVELGITKPWQFFWATGSLSSFLDNTPTYLAFFSMAQGLGLNGDMMGISSIFLKAIGAGPSFMGANSYIGNAQLYGQGHRRGIQVEDALVLRLHVFTRSPSSFRSLSSSRSSFSGRKSHGSRNESHSPRAPRSVFPIPSTSRLSVFGDDAGPAESTLLVVRGWRRPTKKSGQSLKRT